MIKMELMLGSVRDGAEFVSGCGIGGGVNAGGREPDALEDLWCR